MSHQTLEDFIHRISELDIPALEALHRKLARPKRGELGHAVERALATRYRQQQAQAEFIPKLKQIAARLSDDTDPDEMSQAEMLAVCWFKPEWVDKAIERQRRKAAGLPVGGNVPRRRPGQPQPPKASAPPRRAPDNCFPGLERRGEPARAQNSPAATPRPPRQLRP